MSFAAVQTGVGCFSPIVTRRIAGRQPCCWTQGQAWNDAGFGEGYRSSRLLGPVTRARQLGGMAGHIQCSLPRDSRESKRREGDGVVIVDHGSRRAESNAMLNQFVEMYKKRTGHIIVEPAHMELAEPTIAQAFDRCIEQGASRVIISTYFLFPGRHWDRDIPALVANAAKKHPLVPYLVTAPIGLHELMVNVVEDRMNYCLSQVAGEVEECEMCAGTGRCQQRAACTENGSVPAVGSGHAATQNAGPI